MKNNDPQGFISLISTAIPLYQQFPAACFWLINHLTINKQMLSEIMFEHSSADAKQSFGKLLQYCVEIIVKLEESYLDE